MAFAVGVAVTKYLGPEQFGLLSYAKSIAGFLLIVSSLGFESLLHREFLDDQEQGKVMGTAFVLRIGTALASVLFTVVALLLTGNRRPDAAPDRDLLERGGVRVRRSSCGPTSKVSLSRA